VVRRFVKSFELFLPVLERALPPFPLSDVLNRSADANHFPVLLLRLSPRANPPFVSRLGAKAQFKVVGFPMLDGLSKRVFKSRLVVRVVVVNDVIEHRGVFEGTPMDAVHLRGPPRGIRLHVVFPDTNTGDLLRPLEEVVLPFQHSFPILLLGDVLHVKNCLPILPTKRRSAYRQKPPGPIGTPD